MRWFTLTGLVCLVSATTVHAAPWVPSTVCTNSTDSVRKTSDLETYRLRQSPLSLMILGDRPTRYPLSVKSLSNIPKAQNVDAREDNSGESSSYLKPALFIGGALATTAILIRTDQTTFNVIYRWRMTSDPLQDVSPAITDLGDGRASMIIFGGLLAYSFVEKDNRAFQAGKIGLESFIVTGIATQILKHTFGRQRPSTATQSGGRWNGAYLLLNQGSSKRGGYASYDAFPSGHTSTIFSAATTLAEVYHDSPWVSYASYTVATSVAISRVMERAHWLSDCFVGGLIGYFGTELVLRYNHTDKPVVLVPTYDGTQLGLALNVGL